MNVDEAWTLMSEAEELPTEALQWSLDHWDEVSARYLAKLRAAANGASMSESDYEALFYVVHMFAEKFDTRAYVPLCELIAKDDALEMWLGDAITETLPGILINLFDGDVEPLKRAIESPKGDDFARCAALNALAYLVRAKGALGDEDMRAYLARLGQEALPREPNTIWATWAFSIAQLGYEPMRADVARVFSKHWIDEIEAELQDFYAELQLARSEPDGLAAFKGAGIRPFGSTIETLASWSANDDAFDEGEAEAEFDGEPGELPPWIGDEAPYRNPFRDVGRNDPCPCGSGKKYKKCCLAA